MCKQKRREAFTFIVSGQRNFCSVVKPEVNTYTQTTLGECQEHEKGLSFCCLTGLTMFYCSLWSVGGVSCLTARFGYVMDIFLDSTRLLLGGFSVFTLSCTHAALCAFMTLAREVGGSCADCAAHFVSGPVIHWTACSCRLCLCDIID